MRRHVGALIAGITKLAEASVWGVARSCRALRHRLNKSILPLLILATFPQIALANITLVQHASIDAGTASSASLGFTTSNTAGNFIAVCIAAGTSGQTFTVSDSKGNTYRKALQFNETGSGNTLGIFYAENIAGGANTVTVSDTTSSTLRFAILEYSGIVAWGSLDEEIAAQGNSTSPSSGNMTTSANTELLLGAILTGSGATFTAGSGYAAEEGVPGAPNTTLVVEDQMQTTAGTVSANATLSVATQWAAGLAAFKAAPIITGLNPTSGIPGTQVTVTGANFDSTASQGNGNIEFNDTTVTATSWSPTSIVAPVPTRAVTGNVQVSVQGKASNGVSFTVLPGGIHLVQSTKKDAGTTTSSSLAFRSNNTAGNFIAVCIRAGSSGQVFTVTDSLGNSYQQASLLAVAQGSTNGNVLAIYYAANIAGGANTVTVSDTISDTLRFAVLEYSGVATSNPLDVTAAAQGTSSSANSGNATTTTSGDLLLGAISAIDSGTYTAGSGFSIDQSIGSWPNITLITEDQVQPNSGNAAASASLSSSLSWGAVLAAFRAAPPSIISLSPAAGIMGSPVTITGANFGPTQGNSTVTFNGISATPTSWSATSIVVPVPVGAATGNVLVTVSGFASNAVAFAVIPSIASLSPTSGPVGTSVTITGTSFGSSQGSSTVAFNGITATPSSWSATSIVVPVPSAATTGNVVVTVGGLPSNGASFAVAPNITSMSPTSGPVGTSVTITGTKFGTTQGTSTVTFNGTTTAPTNWSDSQIIVLVPSGATTGPVVVTVAGQASNGPKFAVGTPPTITASASPTPNANGWNNTNVTVTFTCTAGSAPIASCPSPQTIASEGANQAISGTATDTDATTTTKSVFLNIDKSTPVLTIASPVDGSTASSAAQVVIGSANDSLSGVSSVTCNGTNASLSSGNFSCNISLNVGVNLIVVRATDLAGNVAGSNFHVSLSGTLPPPQSLTVTPVSATLVVGQTQQLVAVDELGRPRPDATWSVSDPTLATISGDPTLTLIAPGSFTLTATVGGASTSTRWSAATGPLPSGTIQWSAPIASGANVTQMVQAEPVSGGPDLYSVEMNPNTGDTTIRALASDGTQLWSQLFAGTHASAIADGNGGILISYHSSTPNSNYTPIVDLDAQAGAPLWENDSVYLPYQPVSFPLSEAIAPNGTILVAGNFNYALDPKTGAATKLQPANTPLGLLKYWDQQCGGPIDTVPYPLASSGIGASVAADGTLFQVVSTLDLTFLTNCSLAPTSLSLKAYLSQTAPDGTVTFTVFDTESSLVPGNFSFPIAIDVPGCPQCFPAGYIPANQALPGDVFFRVVPDGQGGAFVPWWKDLGNFPNYEAHLTHVSGSAVTDVVLPLTYQNTAYQANNPCPLPYFRPGLPCTTDFRLVLGENGVGFATDLKSVVAFDTASMAPLWTHSSASGMDLVAATAGGGVTINDFQQGIIPLDASGKPGTAMGTPVASVTPWARNSWLGDPTGATTMFVGPNASLANSRWPLVGGDYGQNSAFRLTTATFLPTPPADVNSTNTRFNSTANASQDLKQNVPSTVVTDAIYTDSGSTQELASIPNFISRNANRFDVIGFIGHSWVIGCSNQSNQYCTFSAGLEFVDDWLIRTPNCDLAGFCYFTDMTNPIPPPCTLTGLVQVGNYCYQLQAPCQQGATQIGNWCYRLPLKGAQLAQTRDIILTGAKVVFVASCSTTDVFSGWWDLTLNAPPGGRALVVPDLTTMASLGVNQPPKVPPQNLASIDLVQGTIGYEAFLNTLATPNKTLQDAVNSANTAISAVYGNLDYSHNIGGQLPQVVYMVAKGNSNLCINCGRSQ